jgi:hypothetical protein
MKLNQFVVLLMRMVLMAVLAVSALGTAAFAAGEQSLPVPPIPPPANQIPAPSTPAAAPATAAAPGQQYGPYQEGQEPEGFVRVKTDPVEAGGMCGVKAKLAKGACNPMGFAGMDSQTSAMMEMMMGQAMSMASSIGSTGASQGEQCSKQADLSKMVGMINAAKGLACAAAMSACKDSCEEPSPAPKETAQIAAYKKEAKTCAGYQTNMMMSLMQAMQMGKNFVSNSSCAAAATSLANLPTMTAPPQVVLPTPGDCSDPAVAQSNISCICKATPTNPICGTAVAQTVPTSANISSSGPGSVPRPFTGSSGTGTAGLTPDTSVSAASTKAGTNEQGKGGGGGGFGGGSGGSGAAGGGGGEDPGGAGSSVDKNVITGAGGGGAGGGLGSPGGGGGGKGDGSGGSGKSFFDKFNLAKFLPNKKDYGSRGLAGMSVQSKDGVTGPMGPSLWEKVSNQYQQQKPKLIQDR